MARAHCSYSVWRLEICSFEITKKLRVGSLPIRAIQSCMTATSRCLALRVFSLLFIYLRITVYVSLQGLIRGRIESILIMQNARHWTSLPMWCNYVVYNTNPSKLRDLVNIVYESLTGKELIGHNLSIQYRNIGVQQYVFLCCQIQSQNDVLTVLYKCQYTCHEKNRRFEANFHNFFPFNFNL